MILDQQTATIGIAVATLVMPAVFVGVAVAAWWRRNRGGKLGTRFEALLTLVGAATLGTLALWSPPWQLIGLPLYVAAVLLAVLAFRRHRPSLAGWIVAGFALPWTVLWLVYVVAMLAGTDFAPLATWGGFLAGLGVVLVGLFFVARGDPAWPADATGPDGGRPPRSFGDIGRAIREPAVIGIFRTTDIAALVALILSWTVIGLIPSPSPIINLVAAAVVGAVAASEAHIRAMPSRMRRAFEAFSWLGEWEMARVRQLTGSRVPTTRKGAEVWLERHPETPETRMIRAEFLAFVSRFDEARTTVARMSATTPEERFERISINELVEWMAGGEADIADLEAAVEDLGPRDSDVRLRGEVALAAARTRRLVADPTAADPLAPLLDVRERLGRRADGQVARALRKRLIPTFLVFGVAFGLLSTLATAGSLP